MSESRMKVLITLTDVEPAVLLNAQLEQLHQPGGDVRTELVSPLDDIRGVLRRMKPDLVVFTGALLDPQHVALVRELLWEEVPVVGFADVLEEGSAEKLRGIGYVDVYPKPVVISDVMAGLKRLVDRQALSRSTGLVGESAGIREVLVKVDQIAPVSSTVLVEGESGTGKELVARAIHQRSPRRARPFIAVNLGALPETLLESELFGHEKGAFTGAAERRLGRFELAHTGTLFLDEIGEVPQSTQIKLLRVLEEREFTRVGGTVPIPVDVRVVAATNNPLREQVEAGTFRADLYYRLNVLAIYLPPLRERRDDIPILVRRFVREVTTQHDLKFHGLSADALQLLVDYRWPGNVRELRNLVESMVVLAPGREIQAEDIPRQLREESNGRFLPVHVGPVLRGGDGSRGRELEFIVRSLVELKLQVEELRRRLDDERVARIAGSSVGIGLGGGSGGGSGLGSAGLAAGWLGELQSVGSSGALRGGIEAPGTPPPPNVFSVTPGMTMADIERAAIEAALKETRGNRRRAADMLAIGERTLYRKLKEYGLDAEGSSD